MYKYLFYTLLLSLILSGCNSKSLLQDSHQVKTNTETNNHAQSRTYKNIRFEYKIAPHDRVAIGVYNHPELSSKSTAGMLVDSSGRIHLPLIGSVHLAGLTQPQASKRVQSLYGKYLKRSSVHLEVVNKRAYVVGEVKAPGVVPLPNEQTTLLQAIASVRGFSNYANKEKVVIMRRSGRGTHVEVVDLTNITSLSHVNMMIRPNDIIYVSAIGMKDIAIGVTPLFKLAADALLPFVRYSDLTD